jgi:hypothetical protein
MLKFPAKYEVADYDLVTRIMSLVTDLGLRWSDRTLIIDAEVNISFTSNNSVTKSATSCTYQYLFLD